MPKQNKIIHYGPFVNKSHFIESACGLLMCDINTYDESVFSVNKNDVTCKQCVRSKIFGENH